MTPTSCSSSRRAGPVKLSIAFAPDYAAGGLFYVYYVDRLGDIRIEEMHRSGSGRRLRAHPAAPRLRQSQRRAAPVRARRAALRGAGDGGGGGDPLGNAQNLGTLLGKVIRIDPRAP